MFNIINLDDQAKAITFLNNSGKVKKRYLVINDNVNFGTVPDDFNRNFLTLKKNGEVGAVNNTVVFKNIKDKVDNENFI